MKTIVFDFDGVIIDSFDTVLRELGLLHQKFSLPRLTEERLSELFDGNFWENHRALGLSEESEHELKGELQDALSRTQSEMSIFNGMSALLKELSESFNLIILSSNHEENINTRLKGEGLLNIFTDVSGTETPGNKREKLQSIIETAGDTVLFVADTSGDLLEAEELDILRIGVTWGYHSREKLTLAGPDRIVDSPAELQTYILTIC